MLLMSCVMNPCPGCLGLPVRGGFGWDVVVGQTGVTGVVSSRHKD